MALQTRPGAILRHGTGNLRPEQIEYLFKNKKEIEKVLANIEERREAFLAAAADANKAAADADVAEAKLAGTLEKTERAQAKLEAEKIKAKHNGDAEREALGRRAREVIKSELDAAERDKALDAREKSLDVKGREQEEKLRAREEAVEAQEAEIEARLQDIKKEDAALKDRSGAISKALDDIKRRANAIK